MACHNSMVPYLCPEMPPEQREALDYGERMPIVFHISAIGTVIGTVLAYGMLQSQMGSPATGQAAGMMVGSYIGGGVNFMALKTSYDVPEAVKARVAER